jgi:predicted nucleic-acid-binding Zn-ribbon protein
LWEHIATARSVEAEAAARVAARAAGPKYFVISDAGDKMPGCFEVVAPRGFLQFPDSCPRCGKRADKKCTIGATHLSASRLYRVETLTYRVPHCAACARTTTRTGLLVLLATLAAAAAFVALMSFWLSLRAALVILMTAMLVFIGIRKGRAPLKTPEGIFVRDYDKSCVWFVFRSQTYAQRFCEINIEFIKARAS